MPQFAYTARDHAGTLMKGVLEGASAADVAGSLQAAGQTPLDINEASGAAPSMAPRLTGSWAGSLRDEVRQVDVHHLALVRRGQLGHELSLERVTRRRV